MSWTFFKPSDKYRLRVITLHKCLAPFWHLFERFISNHVGAYTLITNVVKAIKLSELLAYNRKMRDIFDQNSNSNAYFCEIFLIRTQIGAFIIEQESIQRHYRIKIDHGKGFTILHGFSYFSTESSKPGGCTI